MITASESPRQASHNRIYLTLSFIFPAVILGTAFTLNGVFPFGNRHILNVDFLHQYYPFLSDMWHKLREGSISPWSWTAGFGYDYTALIAYYMASPLNILTLIMPHAWMREVLALIVLLKIGFAGLACALFLRYAFKQSSLALAVFPSLYALCAFSTGYFWNIMWLDGFALLPLVIMGFLALINEGRFRLYIVTLAVAMLANFYIGFFVCLLTAITFFCIWIIQKWNFKEFRRKIIMAAGCSALALGIAAIIILPTWSALQSTRSIDSALPNSLALHTSFFNVLGNFIAFTPPTVIDGLPNLYTGMISLMLIGIFFVSSKVVFREKMVVSVVLVLLLLCCNINMLDYVIHGFHKPNLVPFRFTFLISFILTVIAFKAFLLAGDKDFIGGKKHWYILLFMGISALVFILSAFFGSQSKTHTIMSAVLCVIYLLMFLVLFVNKRKAAQYARAGILLVIVAELSVSSWIAVRDADLPIRDNVIGQYDHIAELLDMRESSYNNFYRMDIDGAITSNDSHLFNYEGISFFSSTLNVNVTDFLGGLGLPIFSNGFFYFETSPLTNAVINMRYMISRYGDTAEDIFWERIESRRGSLLLENRRYLPLGFMANEGLSSYVHSTSPFISQNNFFSLATGLERDLFNIRDITQSMRLFNGRMTARYMIPEDGIYYVSCRMENMYVYINEEFLREIFVPHTGMAFYVFPVGNLSQGDIITIVNLSSDSSSIVIGRLDDELFDQGYNRLSSQTLNLTKFTNTVVRGNVTALSDGLLYTSIPGDVNWSVYVNGVKSELLLIDNAMAAVRLEQGTHEVEFRYFNKALLAGAIISLASLIIFIGLIFKYKKSLPQVINSGKNTHPGK